MPGELTEITEIATGLGTLSPDLQSVFLTRPVEVRNVSDSSWGRLAAAYESREHARSFETAFANGVALLQSEDGLRGRRPRLVEWKGPHRPPGDDVIPADLRLDHVYLISCKYRSKILGNAGPSRLFDRLLVGEARDSGNWFETVAPEEYRSLYVKALEFSGLEVPGTSGKLDTEQRARLRIALGARVLPDELRPSWVSLCKTVSEESASRWRRAFTSPTTQLRTLWKLLRITGASYFVLGAERSAALRYRVASNWDWVQAFEFRGMTVNAREAGQPEVSWSARIRNRATGDETEIKGHIEVRWSHGRFSGSPEAKIYLDTPYSAVPGYYPFG